METFFQLLLAGIFAGVAYGVLASGLSLIFGVMKILNFAHAAIAVLAMYIPTYCFLQWWNIDPFISSIIALPIFFVFGYLLQYFLIDRVLGSPEIGDVTLILTLGLSFIIENLILIIFSGSPRIINEPYTLGTWSIGTLLVNKAQTYSTLISGVLIFGLFLFLNKTTLGQAIKAAADDPEGCAYMGINLRSVYGVAFGLGIAITAAGGCLMATYRPFNPFFGESMIIILFAIVVLGGMGSVAGAVVGGLIIGLVQQLSTLVLPVALQNVAVFTIFVLCLYVLPQGLLGKKGRLV